ncbi:hypothetical protein FJT64_002192 [Amphibalanus amphitrite]|uniref:Uncharacterized protein n=1 Tax=Amphibalanus amphitrite TaxID=1232801 RepID=A0A6A4WW53_AMPAM|nr:hypothetical protein FJT64_002192 [Amphibalanus amphitrite]
MRQLSVRDMARRLDETSPTSAAAAAAPAGDALPPAGGGAASAAAGKRGRSESGESAPATKRGSQRGYQRGDRITQLEDTMERAIHKLREQIQQDFDLFSETIRTEFHAIKARIQDIEDHLETKNREIEALSLGLQETKKEVKLLKDRVEENELVNRLSSLVFSGKPFARKPRDANKPEAEDVEKTVLSVVRENFQDLNINASDIARAHRLPGEQKIICRFVRSGRGSLRDQIYYRRMELKGKDIYINECLTKRRAEIFGRLLGLKKDGKLFSVFSRGGQVFCTSERYGKPIRVNTEREVDSLVG